MVAKSVMRKFSKVEAHSKLGRSADVALIGALLSFLSRFFYWPVGGIASSGRAALSDLVSMPPK